MRWEVEDADAVAVALPARYRITYRTLAPTFQPRMTPTTRLVLTRPHTHAGKPYGQATARCGRRRLAAEWLLAHDIAAPGSPEARRRPDWRADLPVQRKEPNPHGTYASFQAASSSANATPTAFPSKCARPATSPSSNCPQTDVLEHYESQTGQRSLDHRMVGQSPPP